MRPLAAVGLGFALLFGACSPEHADAPPAAEVAPPSAPEPAIVLGRIGPAAAPRARPLRVLVAGDLIPHRPSLVAPDRIRAALAPLEPTFAAADVVVANYEAATGNVDDRTFRLAHAAPPGWLEELPRAGIGALSVANNHACDLGFEGLEATLEAARTAGAIAIGGDPHDPWEPRPIVERDGKRVCAIAWTTLMNADSGCARSVRIATAPLDRRGRRRIEAALARAKASCDATIAIIHGGEEYVAQTREVLAQARHAADAGADAVVIHHPHVASPVTVRMTKDGRSVPIFASVGNLVSNQGESWRSSMFPVLRENRRLVCVNGWTRLGVVADLAFDFGAGDGAAIRLDWGFHLTWTDNEHAVDRAAPVPKIETRLLDPERDADIVARLSEDRRGPVALFEDACWTERPARAGADAAREARCTAILPKAGPVPRRLTAKAAAAIRRKP